MFVVCLSVKCKKCDCNAFKVRMHHLECNDCKTRLPIVTLLKYIEELHDENESLSFKNCDLRRHNHE